MLDRSGTLQLVHAVRRERRLNRQALAPTASGDPAEAPRYCDTAFSALCTRIRTGIDQLRHERAAAAPALRAN